MILFNNKTEIVPILKFAHGTTEKRPMCGGGEDGIWAIQTPAFHFALLDQTLFACQGTPHPGDDLNGLVLVK